MGAAGQYYRRAEIIRSILSLASFLILKLRIHPVTAAFALRAGADDHLHQPQLIGAPQARRLDRMDDIYKLHMLTSIYTVPPVDSI